MSQETIFDKILAGELPADVVYEDDDVLAFEDMHPVAPLHVLVLPKRKVESIADLHALDAEYVGRFFQAVARVAAHCGVKEDGYRVVINHGTNGQQEVKYLHAHIIGGRPMLWPPG